MFATNFCSVQLQTETDTPMCLLTNIEKRFCEQRKHFNSCSSAGNTERSDRDMRTNMFFGHLGQTLFGSLVQSRLGYKRMYNNICISRNIDKPCSLCHAEAVGVPVLIPYQPDLQRFMHVCVSERRKRRVSKQV